jgi:hypothetical protein
VTSLGIPRMRVTVRVLSVMALGRGARGSTSLDRQRRRQVAVGVELLLQRGDLLIGGGDRVCADGNPRVPVYVPVVPSTYGRLRTSAD